MIIDGVKVTERGWPGHFICAHRCLFRRNTLIEYKDKKWVISTVGAMRTLDGKLDMIGYNRFFETMAFEAIDQDQYLDADVTKEISFDSELGLFAESWDKLIAEHPLVDKDANDMHEKVVSELISKIRED